ncbi:MAG: tail fiber domain-containing protein [Chitinophagaceae bacterium]
MKTKKLLTILLIFAFVILSLSKGIAQSVGINTTGAPPNSAALLHVDVGNSNKGLLVTGAFNGLSTVPDLGAGSRLMFYPRRAAFRAGYAVGTEWDNAYVGDYSTAMGYNTTASGLISTAMGSSTNASGSGSTAMGRQTTSSGFYSTAMGNSTTAGGASSTAMGLGTTASGGASTAMGVNTTASGDYSTAMGNNVSTNGHVGSFVVGDNSTTTVFNSGTDNRFTARFDGGYRFYTSADLTSSCILANGSNAWSTSSSVYLKENFEDVSGEDYLKKIDGFHLTSWNYKKQDPKTFRHYGPMAQDFYAAFGKDNYGTIGNDSTINQSDFLGVNFIAIQALEKRTTELKNQNATQNKKFTEEAEVKNAEVTQLKKENESLKQSFAQLEKKFDQQQNLIAQSLDQLKALSIKQQHKETIAVK